MTKAALWIPVLLGGVGLSAACGGDDDPAAGSNDDAGVSGSSSSSASSSSSGGGSSSSSSGSSSGAGTTSSSGSTSSSSGESPECTQAGQCPDSANACEEARCTNGACGFGPRIDGTACDDADACTSTDSCQAGTCAGIAVVCVAQDSCHEVGTCTALTGVCTTPSKANGEACGDDSACSNGVCTPRTVTLARQDFEVAPANPVWTFTGPVLYESGTSAAVNAAPAASPLGIGASRAWGTTANSGGLQLEFASVAVPPGFSSVVVRYRLAAMNLISSVGGPDNLDYVLTSLSVDGGAFYSRVRVRGAVNDNSFWPYAATGVARVSYQPEEEQLFQPFTTGLQDELGYSTVEIELPGTITSVALQITARSSSSTDTWLVDDVEVIGRNTIAD